MFMMKSANGATKPGTRRAAPGILIDCPVVLEQLLFLRVFIGKGSDGPGYLDVTQNRSAYKDLNINIDFILIIVIIRSL